ncbi:hypothetical protein MW887_010960 [Aspergillus wentii]|nr:hypothetical protein MW887_010960 [Aspergillus wentii]
MASLVGHGLGAVMGKGKGADDEVHVTNWTAKRSSDSIVDDTSNNNIIRSSPGDFPVCTELDRPFSPFCLPRDGADVTVDSTYYVTWNADYYPLNATVTIELRYPNSSNGDSAFTSEKTDNSYGYITLHMRKEWLQGKARNTLLLYIIELDSASGQRASIRKGPTVTLQPKPVVHYAPPPSLPFNRQALLIGLPVSLGVVMVIVFGLFFGMRKSRRIAVKNIMGSRGKGYGIGKSKNERLNTNRNMEARGSDGLAALGKYSEDDDEGLSEIDPDMYNNELERNANYAFRQHVSKLKSWN